MGCIEGWDSGVPPLQIMYHLNAPCFGMLLPCVSSLSLTWGWFPFATSTGHVWLQVVLKLRDPEPSQLSQDVITDINHALQTKRWVPRVGCHAGYSANYHAVLSCSGLCRVSTSDLGDSAKSRARYTE